MPKDQIHPVVIIEEERAVMKIEVNTPALPRPFHALRGVKIGLAGLLRREADIKAPFIILDGASPHAIAVVAALIRHPRLLRSLEGLEHIAGDLPMNQIIGAEYDRSRQEMQGGAEHIVHIPDPDYIRIGIICFDNWICIFYNSSLSLLHRCLRPFPCFPSGLRL